MRLECGTSIESLVACYEGDLAGAEHASLRLHLEACSECQRWISEFREMDRMLRSRFPPVTDREAQEALKRRLRLVL